MPTAPMLPPEMMARSGAASPVDPANFLMAAAIMSKQGSLPDAAKGRSIPAGINTKLQTGIARGRRAKLQGLK